MMRWNCLSLAAVLWLAAGMSALGQEESAPSTDSKSQVKATEQSAQDADTVVDLNIALDRLKVAVKPLTRQELEVEALAWFDAVREISGQIADRQMEARDELNKPAESTSDVRKSEPQTEESQGETSVSAMKADQVKTAEEHLETVDSLVDLTLEQRELLERFEVVLDSLEEKGGDVSDYRKYLESQREVELNTSDAMAIWVSLKAWFVSKDGGKMWAMRLLAFVIVIVITKMVTGVISALVRRWLKRSSHLSMLAENLISRSLHHVIMLLGFLIALTTLGVDIGPLVAAVGATGFIVGFALQGTLSNFASGLMILLNRPFDVGDVVTAGGVTGKVSQMSLVSTTFSTFDNQKIIVPNNEIWDNVITNVTAQDTRRVDLVFGVSYDDDLETVEQILHQVVQSHPLILDAPEPVIKLNELADSSVNYVCRPWVNVTDYWEVYWDLLKSIKSEFDRAGISIPYPQQDIHVKAEKLSVPE